MNDILKDELCKYLGELMYEKDSEFDMILKDEIILKINAVKVLLEIPIEKTNGSKMYQIAKRFVAKTSEGAHVWQGSQTCGNMEL